jgi:hypothetical protein
MNRNYLDFASNLATPSWPVSQSPASLAREQHLLASRCYFTFPVVLLIFPQSFGPNPDFETRRSLSSSRILAHPRIVPPRIARLPASTRIRVQQLD